MKKVTQIMVFLRVLAFFALIPLDVLAASECDCLNSEAEVPSSFYARVFDSTGVIFVGKLIDRLHINPVDYVAVFEEMKYISGPKSRIKLSWEGRSTQVALRYVLASELDSTCSFRFGNLNQEYIILGQNRSRESNLFFAGKCSGTVEYSDHIFNILMAEAARRGAQR